KARRGAYASRHRRWFEVWGENGTGGGGWRFPARKDVRSAGSRSPARRRILARTAMAEMAKRRDRAFAALRKPGENGGMDVELRHRVISRQPDHQDEATPGRRSQSRPRVSVVVPALNEERNLPFVLPQMRDWVDEVILVDGNSVDGTRLVASSLLPEIR